MKYLTDAQKLGKNGSKITQRNLQTYSEKAN